MKATRMPRSFAPLFFGLLTLTVPAQTECDGLRYSDPAVFDSVTVTLAVPFGANTPVVGSGSQTLYMDVYEPFGDTVSSRPTVLIAFGGSFVGGQRSDVAELCKAFARSGYVAVAPDYRVGFFFPAELSTTRAVMRSAHDLRACVRYLHKSISDLGDPYRIDPDRIIVGGVSAGAIGAVHMAYLDQESEIPAVLYNDTAALGGLAGNSGSPGYPETIAGVISFSGAIGDTAWIDTGDEPMCSIHEVGDYLVPYGTAQVSVAGIPTGLTASGGADMAVRTANVGVENCFLSYPTANHVGYLTLDYAYSFGHVLDFCGKLVCGEPLACGSVFTSVTGPEQLPAPLTVWPNPSSGLVQLVLEERAVVKVLDMMGREVFSDGRNAGRCTLDLGGLPAGTYTIHVLGGTMRTGRVVLDGGGR